MRETNHLFSTGVANKCDKTNVHNRQQLIFPIMTPFHKNLDNQNINEKLDNKSIQRTANKLIFPSDFIVPQTYQPVSQSNSVFNVSIPRTNSESKFYTENRNFFNRIQKEMAEYQIPMCLVQDEKGKLHQLVYTLPKDAYEKYVKSLASKTPSSKDKKPMKNKTSRKPSTDKSISNNDKRNNTYNDAEVNLNLLKQLGSIELSNSKHKPKARTSCKSTLKQAKSNTLTEEKDCVITYASNESNTMTKLQSTKEESDPQKQNSKNLSLSATTKPRDLSRDEGNEFSFSSPIDSELYFEEDPVSTKLSENITEVLNQNTGAVIAPIETNNYKLSDLSDRDSERENQPRISQSASVSNYRKRKSQDSDTETSDSKLFKVQHDNVNLFPSSSSPLLSQETIPISQTMTPISYEITQNSSPDSLCSRDASPACDDLQSVSSSSSMSSSESNSNSPVSFLNLNSVASTTDMDCFLTDGSLKVIENSDFQDLIGDFNPITEDYLENLFDSNCVLQPNDYFDLTPDLYTNEPLDFRIFEQNNFPSSDCTFF